MAEQQAKTIKEQTYLKVEAYRKANPKATVAEAVKRLKLQSAAYYAGKKKLAPETVSAVRYRKLTPKNSSPSGDTGKLVMVMGSADQIRDFIGGLN